MGTARNRRPPVYTLTPHGRRRHAIAGATHRHEAATAFSGHTGRCGDSPSRWAITLSSPTYSAVTFTQSLASSGIVQRTPPRESRSNFNGP